MRPVVISVAITGSVPRKKDNPALPVTVAEQIESTHAAFEAGASLVHVHVRNPDETSSSDPALFEQVMTGVRRHCPGMIVQFSTGGRGRDQSARGYPISLAPDMASLATGSVNFPTIVYENAPALIIELATKMRQFRVKPEIELFDLSMIHGARNLADLGLLTENPHVQFVFGIRNALPARRHLLEIMLAETRRLFPRATWTAAGIGAAQLQVATWALELGGHLRTGMEDNIRISKDRLAASNAQLVAQAAELCGQHGGRPASAAEARQLLDLPAWSV